MSVAALAANEVVRLNVGGQVFETQRATLLSAEGSLLEALFSGRWEESLLRDEGGLVFLDFDPVPFRALLNFLRTRHIAKPGRTVSAPALPPEHAEQFEAMVSFMGLEEVLTGKLSGGPDEAANPVSEEALKCSQAGSRDGIIRTSGGRDFPGRGNVVRDRAQDAGPRCAVGRAPLLSNGSQKSAWKVSMARVPPSGGVLVGITGNPAPGDVSFFDDRTFGWAGEQEVWTAGTCEQAAGSWPGWQEGDVAIFKLDSSQPVLRMHLRRTGVVYSLPIPEDLVPSARLCFGLHNVGTEIEVSQVTQQELLTLGF